MAHDFYERADKRHQLRRIIDGKYNRTFAVASQRPALIRKTVVTIVTENEMVE
ncbi:MAG: hypothetical protein ABL983_14245 [Nitrospira sp.]